MEQAIKIQRKQNVFLPIRINSNFDNKVFSFVRLVRCVVFPSVTQCPPDIVSGDGDTHAPGFFSCTKTARDETLRIMRKLVYLDFQTRFIQFLMVILINLVDIYGSLAV